MNFSYSKQDDLKIAKLFPVLTRKELLSNNIIYQLVNNIRKISELEAEPFKNLYLNFIVHYVEFMQALPNLRYPVFRCDYGQIEIALKRASYIVDFCSHKKIPIPEKPQNITQELHEAIWDFALFSAAILIDAGQVVDRFVIEKSNDKHKNLGKWEMLEENLLQNKITHYKINHITQRPQHELAKKLNVLLAKQIIPDHIFTWMMQDEPIFLEWLNFLEGNNSGSGEIQNAVLLSIRKMAQDIGFILPDINEKFEFFEEFLHQGELDDHYIETDKLIHEKVSANNLSDEKIGDAFIAWLKEEIATKNIDINQSSSFIHILENGFLMLTPEAFSKFIARYPMFGTWETVRHAMEKLGVTPSLATNMIYAQNFLNREIAKKNPKQSALVFNNLNILFDKSNTPEVSKYLSNQKIPDNQLKDLYPTAKTIPKGNSNSPGQHN